MLPEKIYTYLESEDSIVCLSFIEEKKDIYKYLEEERFYIVGKYESSNYNRTIEISDGQMPKAKALGLSCKGQG